MFKSWGHQIWIISMKNACMLDDTLWGQHLGPRCRPGKVSRIVYMVNIWDTNYSFLEGKILIFSVFIPYTIDNKLKHAQSISHCIFQCSNPQKPLLKLHYVWVLSPAGLCPQLLNIPPLYILSLKNSIASELFF